MAKRWPPIPKRIIARMFTSHERRLGASTRPYRVDRLAIDMARITDVETGSSTTWQIKRGVTGVRVICVEDSADRATTAARLAPASLL